MRVAVHRSQLCADSMRTERGSSASGAASPSRNGANSGGGRTMSVTGDLLPMIGTRRGFAFAGMPHERECCRLGGSQLSGWHSGKGLGFPWLYGHPPARSRGMPCCRPCRPHTGWLRPRRSGGRAPSTGRRDPARGAPMRGSATVAAAPRSVRDFPVLSVLSATFRQSARKVADSVLLLYLYLLSPRLRAD